MTKEELLKKVEFEEKWLLVVRYPHATLCDIGIAFDSIKSAIRELESHPCEDAISRQAAIDALGDIHPLDYNQISLKLRLEALPRVMPAPKMGRCRQCKHFEYDSMAKIDGIPLIVAHEICTKWGNGCATWEDGYCHMFESIEEKKEV